MTREEAIKCLKSLLEVRRKYLDMQTCRDEIEALEMAIKALEQEPKWIPVSEKLPETNDDVLIYDGADIFIAWYARKGVWQGWNSSDDRFERNMQIIAWMPLPEPYKAESEE